VVWERAEDRKRKKNIRSGSKQKLKRYAHERAQTERIRWKEVVLGRGGVVHGKEEKIKNEFD